MKNFDLSFLSDSIKYIAGVDEAGRGPLAGPVVAAAVIFDDNTEISGINDSKKLTEKTREILFEIIIQKAVAYQISFVDHSEIDRINILQASLKAMKTSVENLNFKPDLILIDGNKSFHSNIPTKTIVKGDSKSFSIAAASILAKVARDRFMDNLHPTFPEYNWKKNKGYATLEHRQALKNNGHCEYHRLTFLKNLFAENDKLTLFGE